MGGEERSVERRKERGQGGYTPWVLLTLLSPPLPRYEILE